MAEQNSFFSVMIQNPFPLISVFPVLFRRFSPTICHRTVEMRDFAAAHEHPPDAISDYIVIISALSSVPSAFVQQKKSTAFYIV